MLGKIILWVADKIATYVLSQPEISRAVGELLHSKDMVLAGAPVDFHVAGKKGQIRWVDAKVENTFRAEKFVATDTSENPGSGTVILMTVAGDRVVFGIPNRDDVLAGGSRTSFFAVNAAVGKNVFYPIVKPGQWIYYLIRFDDDCAWEAVLYGSIPANEAPTNPVDKQTWS